MKLADYLQKHHVSATDFATLLGVHVSQVSRWASGKRTPNLAQLMDIKRLTKGKVKSEDFVTKKDFAL